MTANEINPAIGAMLKSAREFLTHEHSLFTTLNIEPVLIGRGKATFAVDLPAAFADADGCVHGGLLTLIIDSIFGISVFTALDEFKTIATVSLHTEYLDEVAPGARALCAAECIAIRGDIAHVSGDLRAEDTGKLLASGAGTFLIGTRNVAKGSRL